MSTRTFRVTVTVEHECTADIAIDEDEYLEWLEGAEDNEDMRLEFLRAGDELEVIADVCNNSDGLGEVNHSAITAVK